VTYPPQPPGPHGQQYPPPPPPPGYGQQQYPPPNPYPQQPPQPQYGQQPYGQQPGQFGQQFPGGMPPRPPRKSNTKVLLIVLGVVVVPLLAFGGVVWWVWSNPQPKTTASAGASTTHTSAPTTTHSAPTSGSSSSGGSAPTEAKAVADRFVAAVNKHDADAATQLVCAADRDEYAKVAATPNSVFDPSTNTHMELTSIAKTDSTHATAKIHTVGTKNGEQRSQDATVLITKQSAGWFVCNT
jgi:flagellar basal body-associated protein FliL